MLVVDSIRAIGAECSEMIGIWSFGRTGKETLGIVSGVGVVAESFGWGSKKSPAVPVEGPGAMGNLKSGIGPDPFLLVGDIPSTGVLGAVVALGPLAKPCFEGGNEWLLNTGEGSGPRGDRRGSTAD
jgi:hypothetical protein